MWWDYTTYTSWMARITNRDRITFPHPRSVFPNKTVSTQHKHCLSSWVDMHQHILPPSGPFSLHYTCRNHAWVYVCAWGTYTCATIMSSTSHERVRLLGNAQFKPCTRVPRPQWPELPLCVSTSTPSINHVHRASHTLWFVWWQRINRYLRCTVDRLK